MPRSGVVGIWTPDSVQRKGTQGNDAYDDQNLDHLITSYIEPVSLYAYYSSHRRASV